MNRLFLAFLLLALPIAPVGLTGASCPAKQQTITYNTLATVGQGVNAAYAAWNDQVVQGRAIFNVTVADKYNAFQKAYAVAVQAASMNINAIAPADLITLSNELLALIKQFTK